MNEMGVLLFLRDGQEAEQFRSALKRAGCVIQCPDTTLVAPCEVVVADQLDLSALPEPLRKAQARGEIGLIQIGTLCGGDVVLPADCRPRELVLACRLLAEIVRLRRAARRSRDAQRTWQRLAERDALTNIPNRRTWNRSLQSRLSSHRPESTCCIVLLDVDHFKAINDELGHATGDAALQAVAAAFRDSLRRGDLAARLGGDEFAVLLADVDPALIDNVVERIRSRAGEAASRAVGRPVSLSAGYALLGGGNPAAAMKAADTALRQAKLEGRNTSRRRSIRESA